MKITELLTITEVSISVATVAFVLLVIFLIITSIKTRKAIESAQVDLHRLSLETTLLVSKLSDLTDDIKKKIEGVGLLTPNPENHNESPRITPQLIGWAVSSFLFLRKAKNLFKKVW